MAQAANEGRPEFDVATLGEVLYAERTQSLVPEAEWTQLVHAVAAGDELALHALYERTHRLVFTLALRMSGSRETAEDLTLDVFVDLWQAAAGYDPAQGTVLGWIMNQARSRTVDRLRREHGREAGEPDESDAARPEAASGTAGAIPFRQQRETLERAVLQLTPDEREAIECAFFSGLTCAEVALRLDQPLGTLRTRIRTGLHKLRQALAVEGSRP